MDNQLVEDLLEMMKHRFYGKYRGTVVASEDPTSRGRLQVSVPAVTEDLVLWAMPCVPYAGDGVGFYALPPVGAGVWVEFEGGDPSYPIWVGCFWADGQLPDDSDQQIKILKTAQLTLRLDDTNDEILMETGSGATVTMTDQIESKVQSVSHTVSSSGATTDSGSVGKVEVSSSSVNVNSGALEVT